MLQKMKLIIFSCVIVILCDFLFVVSFAFYSEKESKNLPNEIKFDEIFIYNADKNINDFYLLNWAHSKEDSVNCSELSDDILNSNLFRLSKIENIVIHFLQSKDNSIIQIKPNVVDLNSNNFVNSVSVVKVFGSYYVIVGFSEKIDDSWVLTSTVYESRSDLSELYEFETDKPRYYFYEFYPTSLASFYSSWIGKVLSILFVFGEISVVYFALAKKSIKDQSRDGSVSYSRKS